jgi:hypothetical protein
MKGGVFNRQKFKIEESPIQKIKNSKTRKTPKFIKDKIFDEILKRRLEVLKTEDAKDRQKAKAIHMYRIQKWLQKVEDKIDEELITDFDNWIQGKSPFNDPKFTPWGRHALVGDEFEAYLKEIVSKKIDYMRDITLLRSSIPKNLEEAWLYYIMLIRGVPIPFDLYYTHFEGVIPFRDRKSNAIGGQGAQQGFNDKRSQELSTDDNEGRKYRSAKTKFGRDYTENIQDVFLPKETTSGRLQQTLGKIPTIPTDSPKGGFLTKKRELEKIGIDTTGNAEKRTEEDVHFPLNAYTHKDLGKAAVTSEEEEKEKQEEEQETAENDSSSFSEGVVPSSPVSPESLEEEIFLEQPHSQHKKEEERKEEERKEEEKEKEEKEKEERKEEERKEEQETEQRKEQEKSKTKKTRGTKETPKTPTVIPTKTSKTGPQTRSQTKKQQEEEEGFKAKIQRLKKENENYRRLIDENERKYENKKISIEERDENKKNLELQVKSNEEAIKGYKEQLAGLESSKETVPKPKSSNTKSRPK